MLVYLYVYLSCFVVFYGFRTMEASDPCLTEGNGMCDLLPSKKCLFTSNYTLKQLQVTRLEIIDSISQFLEVQWTYASESRFLVRTIPVSNNKYQRHLETCIDGRLLEKSSINTMPEKDKILNYSSRIPLLKNVTAYIVDIGVNELIKQAVRLFVLIPPKNKIISPIVAVRISQSWARLVVFERSKSASINYQCTKVVCGSESLTKMSNGSNWQFEKCNPTNSVPCDTLLTSGTPTCIELKEGEMYQIYIDSSINTIHQLTDVNELLRTPVFGSRINGISEESVKMEDYSVNAWDFCHEQITSPETASFGIRQMRELDSKGFTDVTNAGVIAAVIVSTTFFASIVIAAVVIGIRAKRHGLSRIHFLKTLEKAVCFYRKTSHQNVTVSTQATVELNDDTLLQVDTDHPGSFVPLLNNVTRKDKCLKLNALEGKYDESCSMGQICSTEDINAIENSETLREREWLAISGPKSKSDLFLAKDQLQHIQSQNQEVMDYFKHVAACTSDNISTRTLSNISLYSSFQSLTNSSCTCLPRDIVPPEPIEGNITWLELNKEFMSINKNYEPFS